MTKEYIVERIKGERRRNGKMEYLVKWENYSESESTWEPVNLLRNNIALQQYLAVKKNKKSERSNSSSPKKSSTSSSGSTSSKAKLSSKSRPNTSTNHSPVKVAFNRQTNKASESSSSSHHSSNSASSSATITIPDLSIQTNCDINKGLIVNTITFNGIKRKYETKFNSSVFISRQ